MMLSFPPAKLGNMKKFLQTIGAVVIVLVLALPRAYERFLPINNSAALALGAEEPENIGKTVVECLNRHNRLGVWWDFLPADFLKAHDDLGGSWSSSHYVITGRLGWHVTWAAIIPLETEPPTAFETFGAENNIDGAFGRAELPIRILGTLKRCGVLFGGIYPDALPFE
jgi:hypothetical protein